MNSKDIISLYLKSIVPTISTESIEMYRSLTTLKKISKGETLIAIGEKTYKCYIIKSGLAASFISHKDGTYFIKTIFKELLSFGSSQSLFLNTKSTIAYKTLTDCEAYEIDYKKFLKIDNNEFKEFQFNLLKKIYLYTEKRIAELTGYNASERYIQLRTDFPNIDNILPQYQIANYLNITPVQLSRIRRKL